MNQNAALKAFDGNSEAGKLLRNLYGGHMKSPNIEYPKLNVSKAKQNEAKPKWSGLKPGADDPHAAKRVPAKRVAVPHKARPERQYHPIDAVARRRSAETINVELDDMRMREECYRPAHVKPISSEAEKAKMQERFQYGGGKALPDEMTQAKGPLPSEQLVRRKEADRVKQVNARRRGEDPQAAAAAQAPPREQGLVEQIIGEIEERQAYLNEMKDVWKADPAARDQAENRIMAEISTRMAELERLERTGAR